MSVKHPSQELLAEYTAGSLAFGPALCVATHIEGCHDCNMQASNFALLGSALLRQEQDIPVDDALLARVLERIDSDNDDTHAHDGAAFKKRGNVPVLNQLLPGGLDAVPWKKIAGGISSYRLELDDPEHSVSLMRVAKGRGVFNHTHSHNEFTTLLQGGYSDEFGSFTAGDFIELDDSHNHAPVAHRDQDCILLTAVSGQLQFSNPIARLFSRFMQL